MSDVIWGKVISSMKDGALGFWISKGNSRNLFKYKALEKIRIIEIDTPDHLTPIDPQSAENCEESLFNRDIRCEVLAKDMRGRLVCRAYLEN